jgi:hypothetical protein
MHVGEVLGPVLSAQSPFTEGGFVLSTGGGGGLGFYGAVAGRYLARRVQDGRTCAEAAADLRDLLDTQRAKCLAVMALWGVEVDRPVELEGGVTLLPFASIPDSDTKKWVEGTSQEHPGTQFYGSVLLQQPPPSALCRQFDASPVLFRAGSQPTVTGPSPSELFAEIALVMALSGPCSPLTGPQWTQFLDPVIERAKFGVMVGLSRMEVVPEPYVEPARLQADLVQEIVKEYLNTGGQVRDRLRVSLTRFHRAMSRHNDGDKAVDLAVSLEAILTDGSGEHTFKTALRAGLLTKGSELDRMRARAIVSAIYRLRSMVVHNGQPPQTIGVAGSSESSVAVIEEAARVTATVLRRIVHDRLIPDWSRFDLNSGIDSTG